MRTDDGAGGPGELFLRLSRRLRVAYVERLGPLGLTPAQARALDTIGRCDSPLRMVDLAERLRVVPRAVTTLVDALEEAGLVLRRTDPANRRSTLLELTDHGRATREQFTRIRTATADSMFAALTERQRETLHDLLRKLDEQ